MLAACEVNLAYLSIATSDARLLTTFTPQIARMITQILRMHTSRGVKVFLAALTEAVVLLRQTRKDDFTKNKYQCLPQTTSSRSIQLYSLDQNHHCKLIDANFTTTRLPLQSQLFAFTLRTPKHYPVKLHFLIQYYSLYS